MNDAPRHLRRLTRPKPREQARLPGDDSRVEFQRGVDVIVAGVLAQVTDQWQPLHPIIRARFGEVHHVRKASVLARLSEKPEVELYGEAQGMKIRKRI